jgi:dipeptidyl aminopeptidase/acylaminoacyl peptidase
MTKTTAPYGSWISPITTDLIAGQSLRLDGLTVDGTTLVWSESRPAEDGRTVLVRRNAAGEIHDLTPPPFSARTRVHEYGGGAYAAHRAVTVFSNVPDNRVYRIDRDGAITALTHRRDQRFADFEFDPQRDRVFAVREDHGSPGEPVNCLVTLDLTGSPSGGRVLTGGHDFVASPRLSPDGRQLAWLTWDHPNMPWDETTLWCAEIHPDGRLGPTRRVAGGRSISVQEPRWSPAGVLHYVCDETGWWNLYRWTDQGAVPLCQTRQEFGGPAWTLGHATYDFLEGNRIVCAPTDDGRQGLYTLGQGGLTPLATPLDTTTVLRAFNGRVALVGAETTDPGGIALLNPEDGTVEWIRRVASSAFDRSDVSLPQAFSFPTDGGLKAHAFFYPPRNTSFRGPAREKPPLLVMSHGGPTGATSTGFSLKIQYWTSRGFAVADVNYGGSTGYGRAYRTRLDGKWGLVDTADCLNAARHLAAEGRVDPDRMAIRGQSAGGYTTLAALTFHDLFAAGTSQYGIGDLLALARDTHKFESRYLDRLVGPLPECTADYEARSPLQHAHQFSCPVLFLQGLDDKVVPPNQAEAMVAALDARGVPVAHLTFEGEGHGFRRRKTIQVALEAELTFYGRVFRFHPVHALATLKIRHLP